MVPVLVIVYLLNIVNCQSLPRFESGGTNLTNNSYIYYANISDGDSALKCVTDSDNCCNDFHVGNWTDERGRAVQQGADEATCLYVTRGHGVVNLNRKSDCIPESSGLWKCDIPDSSEVIQSIYIYISNDATSGILKIKLLNITLHTELNVSPPEFTIMCLTEGGPATTVLWRRPNGSIIEQGDSDHETSQIIVDKRNSTYENRLRVRGREGGRWICSVSNNIRDYFRNLGNSVYRPLHIHVAEEPTELSATSQSNSTHVHVTVTWNYPFLLHPQDRGITGYMIYYQAKGGAVNSVMVSGQAARRHLLNGQRGVTYNISIVALSQHLPSPLVGPVTLISEPILRVAVLPSPSVTVSPNDQFTLTCTARTEIDGQGVPLSLLIIWSRITISPFGSMNESQLTPAEYDITTIGSYESGYQSILTTTENGMVNTIIYRCRVKMPSYNAVDLDVTVTVKAAASTPSSETSTTLSSETTTTSTLASNETTPTIITPSSKTTENNANSTDTCHCTNVEMSSTDNTAVVAGVVGGVTGLIIIIQSVVIVHLRNNAKSRAKRTSPENEHTVKMVVTSSNSAYGVVLVQEREHEYDVIGLQQTHTQHSSTAGSSHL